MAALAPPAARSDVRARIAAWEPLEPTGDPYADLRGELQAARRLRIDFSTAWMIARSRAAACLPPGRSRGQRSEFMRATTATRDEWERAFYGLGARLRAVEAIRDGLVDEQEAHRVVPPAIDAD